MIVSLNCRAISLGKNRSKGRGVPQYLSDNCLNNPQKIDDSFRDIIVSYMRSKNPYELFQYEEGLGVRFSMQKHRNQVVALLIESIEKKFCFNLNIPLDWNQRSNYEDC